MCVELHNPTIIKIKFFKNVIRVLFSSCRYRQLFCGTFSFFVICVEVALLNLPSSYTKECPNFPNLYKEVEIRVPQHSPTQNLMIIFFVFKRNTACWLMCGHTSPLEHGSIPLVEGHTIMVAYVATVTVTLFSLCVCVYFMSSHISSYHLVTLYVLHQSILLSLCMCKKIVV